MLYVLSTTFKRVMKSRYDKLVREAGLVAHPLTQTRYRSLAFDASVTKIEKPLCGEKQKTFYCDKLNSFEGSVSDNEMAKTIFEIKDQNGKPDFYENGKPFYTFDDHPIFGKYMFSKSTTIL
ncbi:hypothetical protein RB653_000085 [Dictyostelium firmibasis]|uniref:Uncharacterized protein n=1 Tax=Dictyostelium firmibasis TaxID=79012 RepID=A0AAN7YXM4_9MYCE